MKREYTVSALSGIRAIELAEGVAGEYCGKLLADFGAEVIKIEPPSGSPVRGLGPFVREEQGEDASALFAYLNTNKRSAVLDLETAQDRAALSRLVERADVVIDDHLPGWLAGVGLDPEQVGHTNPALVLCAITAYGQTSSSAAVPAEDLTLFHASGWGLHTPGGAEPARPPLKGAGRFAVSYEAALDAALCIAAVLYERQQSGKGQVIDIAKRRVMASRLDYVLGQMVVGDMDVSESRGAYDLGGPAAIMPCMDGFVYVWLSDEKMWRSMRELMGEPGWMEEFPADWLRNGCTPERVARSRAGLTEWLQTQRKHEIAAEAQQRGIMIVPVNTAPDLMASPQYQFRKFFAEVDHPLLGRLTYPTVPYRMSATPAAITGPAPMLGEHTEQTLAQTQAAR